MDFPWKKTINFGNFRMNGNRKPLRQVHSLWLAEVEVPHLWLGPGKETSDFEIFFGGNFGGVDHDLTMKNDEKCWIWPSKSWWPWWKMQFFFLVHQESWKPFRLWWKKCCFFFWSIKSRENPLDYGEKHAVFFWVHQASWKPLRFSHQEWWDFWGFRNHTHLTSLSIMFFSWLLIDLRAVKYIGITAIPPQVKISRDIIPRMAYSSLV